MKASNESWTWSALGTVLSRSKTTLFARFAKIGLQALCLKSNRHTSAFTQIGKKLKPNAGSAPPAHMHPLLWLVACSVSKCDIKNGMRFVSGSVSILFALLLFFSCCSVPFVLFRSGSDPLSLFIGSFLSPFVPVFNSFLCCASVRVTLFINSSSLFVFWLFVYVCVLDMRFRCQDISSSGCLSVFAVVFGNIAHPTHREMHAATASLFENVEIPSFW